MDKKTRQSLRFCQRVTRTQARNFYYGLKLTPQPKRAALYTIYAFMRACDDLVDMPVEVAAPTPAQVTAAATEPDTPSVISRGIARVEDFRQRMQQALDDPAAAATEPAQSVWPAFSYVAHHYPIEPDHLHAMLDGQRADLVQSRYKTFEDLYQYCYNVAGTVGLVCVSIWGVTDVAANKLAEYRGIALQLTNILRDLAEDFSRGRVYLPDEDLERFGVDPAMFTRGEANDSFDRFMKFQIERARSYYEMSYKLEQYITPDCRPTSLAIMRIYRALLDEIANDPRRVLTTRVRLSKAKKLRIMMGAYFGR
jgi:phytoene synthase